MSKLPKDDKSTPNPTTKIVEAKAVFILETTCLTDYQALQNLDVLLDEALFRIKELKKYGNLKMETCYYDWKVTEKENEQK